MVMIPAYEAGVLVAPSVPVSESVLVVPEIVVSPAYVLAPLNTSVPAPDFAKSAPVDPAITPGYVNVVDVGTLMVPSLVSRVIPRLASIETDAVTSSAPPFKMR
jgi:hypothetical protein